MYLKDLASGLYTATEARSFNIIDHYARKLPRNTFEGDWWNTLLDSAAASGFLGGVKTLVANQFEKSSQGAPLRRPCTTP